MQGGIVRLTPWARARVGDLRAAGTWARKRLARTWRGRHRLPRALELAAVVATLMGFMVTFTVDLEDRQSERTFRAWQVVRGFENREGGAAGSSLREALQFLNREFDGALCIPPVGWISDYLTGNRRECVFPRKNRESLAELEARRTNLTGADLSGADLSGADLTHADLSGADLSGADLRNARLIGTNFRNANLIGTDFGEADLSAVELAVAGVQEVLASYGFLDYTYDHISKALRDGSLTCAIVSEAFSQVLRHGRLGHPRPRTDLSGANLTDANLAGVNLLLANLTDATLRETRLMRADLSCVDLTGTDLTGATLTGANTTGTRFTPMIMAPPAQRRTASSQP